MKRVLVVEDNAEVRSLLLELLQHAGYDVECVWRFNEAKAKLQRDRFDLVIANILLPGGGNGAELAAMAQARGMKHLLVTGHPEQMQLMDLMQEPYMAKPFRASDLVERINRLWDGA